MTKQQFLDELRNHLVPLTDEEIDDILEEYAGYIDEKINDGFTEEQTVEGFGAISDLANEILSAYKIRPSKENGKDEKKKFNFDFSQWSEVFSTIVNNCIDFTQALFKKLSIEGVSRMLVLFLVALVCVAIIRIPFVFIENLGNHLLEMLLPNFFADILCILWGLEVGIVNLFVAISILYGFYKAARDNKPIDLKEIISTSIVKDLNISSKHEETLNNWSDKLNQNCDDLAQDLKQKFKTQDESVKEPVKDADLTDENKDAASTSTDEVMDAEIISKSDDSKEESTSEEKIVSDETDATLETKNQNDLDEEDKISRETTLPPSDQNEITIEEHLKKKHHRRKEHPHKEKEPKEKRPSLICQVFLLMLRCCLFLFSLPFIGALIGLFIGLGIITFLFINGVNVLGFFMACSGLILIVYAIIAVLNRIIFTGKAKKIGIVFLVGILLTTMGSLFALKDITSFEIIPYRDFVSEVNVDSKDFTLDKDLVLTFSGKESQVNFIGIEDKPLNEVTVRYITPYPYETAVNSIKETLDMPAHHNFNPYLPTDANPVSIFFKNGLNSLKKGYILDIDQVGYFEIRCNPAVVEQIQTEIISTWYQEYTIPAQTN